MNEAALYITLRVRDLASGPLGKLQEQIAALSKSTGLSALGGNLALAGAGITAVGAAVGFALGKTVEAAMKADDSTRHMMTAFDLSAPAAEQAKHLADTLAMVKSVSQATGISQDQLKDSVYNAKMMMLSDAQANAVAASAAKLAIGTTHDFAAAQAAQADVSRMLATATNVLGGSASDLSDKFALLQSHYGFKSIDDLQSAMAHVLPSMKGVKMEASDTFAAMAVLSTNGYQSERIGMGLNELIAKLTTGKSQLRAMVVANAESGLDVEGTLGRISAITAGMSGLQRAGYLKTLGFNLRDVQVVQTLLDHMNELGAARADLAKSGGATDKLFNLRSQGSDQQWAQMWNNFHILQETIGNSLLPTFNAFVLKINTAVIAITDFADKHPALVKFVALFAALSAGVLVVVGGLLVLAGAVASGIAAFAALGVGGPIIAGIVAVGLAIAGVVAAVAAFAPQFFRAGFNIAKSIADGILSGIEHPLAAIEKLAKVIRDHLPFSPAKLGPLRDLGHIRVSETIAAAIRPAPVMRAMGTVAAGIAMTGAMMGTPAYAAPPRAPSITINMPIRTGDIYDAGGFKQALQEHRSELYEALERELSKRGRTAF